MMSWVDFADEGLLYTLFSSLSLLEESEGMVRVHSSPAPHLLHYLTDNAP